MKLPSIIKEELYSLKRRSHVSRDDIAYMKIENYFTQRAECTASIGNGKLSISKDGMVTFKYDLINSNYLLDNSDINEIFIKSLVDLPIEYSSVISENNKRNLFQKEIRELENSYNESVNELVETVLETIPSVSINVGSTLTSLRKSQVESNIISNDSEVKLSDFLSWIIQMDNKDDLFIEQLETVYNRSK